MHLSQYLRKEPIDSRTENLLFKNFPKKIQDNSVQTKNRIECDGGVCVFKKFLIGYSYSGRNGFVGQTVNDKIFGHIGLSAYTYQGPGITLYTTTAF